MPTQSAYEVALWLDVMAGFTAFTAVLVRDASCGRTRGVSLAVFCARCLVCPAPSGLNCHPSVVLRLVRSDVRQLDRECQK